MGNMSILKDVNLFETKYPDSFYRVKVVLDDKSRVGYVCALAGFFEVEKQFGVWLANQRAQLCIDLGLLK